MHHRPAAAAATFAMTAVPAAAGAAAAVADDAAPVALPSAGLESKQDEAVTAETTVGNAAPAADQTAFPDGRPADEEILRFEKLAKAKELAVPLVGDMSDFKALYEEYEHGLPVYVDKIKHLQSTCLGLRNIRKDGNCFYRGFGFRLCELVWENRGLPWHQAIVERARGTRDLMATMGYDISLLSDFYEKFEEMLMIDEERKDALVDGFRLDYVSDTIVCYLRLVTAALLKRDRDMYEAFVFDAYPTLDSFIGECVEPMNVESDQIHIVAMANALGIDVRIANLDTAKAENGINYLDISPLQPLPVDQAPSITLLYRPGHYDILYPKPLV